MLCRFPFMRGLDAFPCGQCLACRVRRRREWTHRLMLEQRKHERSCFVTLTYSSDNLPEGGNLDPDAFQLWLKRFRKAVAPVSVRFFAAGEYGDTYYRPHYHVALFGVGPGLDHHRGERPRCHCGFCQVMRSTWPFGFVDVGELNEKSAQYVAGYVVDKLAKRKDGRLAQLVPEFQRMSLRPGIGAWAMKDVANSLNDSFGASYINEVGDVPVVLRHGKAKLLPLGRYLRRRLRDEMGFDEIGGQERSMAARRAEMSALREAYGSSKAFEAAKPFVDWSAGDSLEARQRIWKKKGSL